MEDSTDGTAPSLNGRNYGLFNLIKVNSCRCWSCFSFISDSLIEKWYVLLLCYRKC